jgi:hypothetical protein
MFAPSDFGEVLVPIGYSGSFFTITKAQRSKIEWIVEPVAGESCHRHHLSKTP